MGQRKTKAKKDDDDLEEEEIDDEELDEEEEDEDDEDDDKSKKSKMIPQSKVNRIMAREKKAGVRSGIRQVLKELGFDSIDEAKESLTRSDEEDEEDDKGKSKTSDREKAAAAKEKADAATARKEVARERLMAKAERKLTAALVKAKVDPDQIDRLATKGVRLLDLEDDADDDDIADAIETLQEDMPQLFTPAEEETEDDDDDESEGQKKKPKRPSRNSAPRSHAGGGPRQKRKAPAKDRATARLHERHPNLAKKE